MSKIQIIYQKIFIILSVLFAEACNEGWGCAAERLLNTASNYENISQRWRVTDDTVFDLTEAQTSRIAIAMSLQLSYPAGKIHSCESRTDMVL